VSTSPTRGEVKIFPSARSMLRENPDYTLSRKGER
jgi:hypothetical protein